MNVYKVVYVNGTFTNVFFVTCSDPEKARDYVNRALGYQGWIQTVELLGEA